MQPFLEISDGKGPQGWEFLTFHVQLSAGQNVRGRS
jgi:hypothetical protein